MGKNTSPVGQVLLLIRLDGGGPSLVEVIEDDVGVGNDQVSVEMIDQIVPNRQVDPLLLIDEGSAILVRGLDNLKLVLGTDAT